MKTHEELLAEGRRIEAVGSLHVDEHRRVTLAGGVMRPRVFPTVFTPAAAAIVKCRRPHRESGYETLTHRCHGRRITQEV